MKEFCKKLAEMIRVIFGYGIMIVLFAGGMTFFGYVAALIIGGETATAICAFLYKSLIPVIIRISTILVLMGLMAMYLNGEVALTSNKKKPSKS